MAVSDNLKSKVELGRKLIAKNGATEEYANAMLEYGRYIDQKEGDLEYGLQVVAEAKACAIEVIQKGTGVEDVWKLDAYCQENNVKYKIMEIYFGCLLEEARNHNLDSYMLYLEKNRAPKDRFYKPRRKQLMKVGVIQALQDLIDGKLDRLSLSLPPGVGKTTVELFMLSGMMGWFPEDYNIFWSHSGDIVGMVYKAVYDILTSDEYLWGEIFYGKAVTYKDANLMKINIGKYKSFTNFQGTSIGSSNAGKIRANRLLMCDDLISGIEVALNKNRLDKLWDIYRVDSRQRKVEGCAELHVATRWSVHDVIGRLQNIYDGEDRQRFIAVPDIDPETGESNFEYEYNGFSKEFFADQERVMDEVSYRCLYKNEPIEREGLLYHEDELRRYLELPSREPDAIVGVCDTKSKGIDYMVLPVFYQYDNDFYLVDCICDDSSDFAYQYDRLTNILIDHKVQQCEFESNAGGDRIAFEVMNRLKEARCHCNVTTKATETNKETRIIVNSDFIKQNVLFRSQDQIKVKSDYDVMMKQMLTYSVAGKNVHDDVVDCLANFSLFIANKERIRPTTIIRGVF